MSFEIRINGIPFTLWESATAHRSIDSNSGSFRFTNSSNSPVNSYPVKAGDFVEILISGVRKVAGFVDDVPGSGDVNLHMVEPFGRDNTSDLIDSSVPDSAKVTEGPISLKKLCEKVIGSLGAKIKVTQKVDNIAEFTTKDLQAASSGQKCMEYLVSFARKRQVYLVPDGAGGLVIFRPDINNKSKTPLLNLKNGKNNNVKSYSFKRSQQDRFNKYRCRSQDNFGFDPFADYSGEGTDRKSEVFDSQIRSSRYLEIQAEESMDDSTCKERAAEESNIRRALAKNYTASVAGTTQADGTVWDFGQYVPIIDEYAQFSGDFLIKEVEYAIDISGGSRTQLTCVPPDAYQVKAEPTKESKRSANTGTSFQSDKPAQQNINLR